MDNLTLVTDKIKELKPLYDRMDATKSRLWDPFVLRGFDNKKMANAVHVTHNRALVQANSVITDLLGARWQVMVNGKLSDAKKTKVRQFVEDILMQADDSLAARGEPWLFDWLCTHVVVRSFIGVSWTLQVIEDEVNLNCIPVDMRWCPWEYGAQNLEWFANITFRTRAQIQSEYPEFTPGKSANIEVIDFWNGKKNEVYIERTKVDEQENILGEPPLVVAAPATGFMLRDVGYLKHEAEDVFFLNRELFDEENRSLSEAATLALEALKPPYQQPVRDEHWDTAHPTEPPPGTGETKQVHEGSEYKLLPRGDVNMAYQVTKGEVQKALDSGGTNAIDLGNMTGDRPALLITSQYEIRSKVLNPRLRAIARLYEQSAAMVRKQIIRTLKEGKTVTIGRPGQKNSYAMSDIGDPEKDSITYELKPRSRTEEIANRAEFQATRGELPLRVRLRDILQADDPEAIIRELKQEEMKAADPAIALFDMAIAAVEEADALDEASEYLQADAKRIQSKMLTERCVAIMNQRLVPQGLPEGAVVPEAERKGGNSNLMQSAMKMLTQPAARMPAQSGVSNAG